MVTEDSPGLYLTTQILPNHLEEKIKAVEVNEDFEMYLMWEPGPPCSRVALGMVKWSWNARADFNDEEKWVITSQNHSPSIAWTGDKWTTLREPATNAYDLEWVTDKPWGDANR